MKTTIRIFLGLFFLGFILKLYHIAGGEAIVALTSMTLTVLLIITFVKGIIKKDTLIYNKLFDLNLILWLDYFVARLRFCNWLLGYFEFFLCVGISVYLIFKIEHSDKLFKVKRAVLILLIICGSLMTQVHSYSIYRTINMNALTKSNINSRAYERYSYFLFINGKIEEGIIAGEKAIELSIIENGENSKETIRFKEKLEQRKNRNFVN
jgi:hypothetical protein